MQIISLPEQAAITYKYFWDGSSPSIKENGTLYVENGRISTKVKEAVPSSAWDFSNYFLLPALIDGHVHLMLPETAQNYAERLRCYLNAGVYAIRDAGNKHGFIEITEPCLVLQAGFALYKKGHYGSALGLGVSTMDEALAAIDQLAAQGAAHIKIMASGIFSFRHYGKTGAATFTVSELKHIVNRAQSYNLPVMAHASGDEAVRRCLEAQVTTIEHGYFMSADTLRHLAASETFWLPTLAPVKAQLATPNLAAKLTPKMHDVIKRSYERHSRLVGEAGALGVKIVAGTDAGAPGVEHGKSLAWEISLLHEAGLSKYAALQAATTLAAAACKLTDAGTLTAGKKPYILAVAGNPLTDPTVLQKPVALLLGPN
ncbi:MAG: amidohydrolase family protein [Firmicutes bacterium]|nr:amidohydrolase family protein [Bacillota bacterium]